jgi:hypothetical protein
VLDGPANRRRRPQKARALPPAILCKPFGFWKMCGAMGRRKVVKKNQISRFRNNVNDQANDPDLSVARRQTTSKREGHWCPAII